MKKRMKIIEHTFSCLQRIAALLIVASFLAGILPAFPVFAAAEEGEPQPAAILLDFSQLKSKNNAETNNRWMITEYGSAGFTIDMEKGYFSSHRVYSGSAMGGFSAPHIEMGRSSQAQWLIDKNRQFVIDFTVPATGLYTVDLTGGVWFAGGVADIFVDEEYIGDYDFCNYDETKTLGRTLGEKKILKTVSLRAGAHEISLRARGGSLHDSAYFIPYQINLIPAEEAARIDQVIATAPQNTMLTGEIQMLAGSVNMTDGSSYAFGYTDSGEVNSGESASVVSSNPAVVEVSQTSLREAGKASKFSAQLTARADGSANIMVSVRLASGEEKTTAIPMTVETGVLSRAELTLPQNQVYAGNTVQASAKAYLSNGSECKNARFTYASSNAEIAEVDAETGLITAVKEGSVTITVTAIRGTESVQDTKEFTVAANYLKSLSFSQAQLTMLLGDRVTVSPAGVRADGSPADLSGYTLDYQSSDASVVSVDGSGRLDANGLGQAVITLTAAKGQEQASASLTVTVSETVESFRLNFSAVTTSNDSGKHEIIEYNDAGFTVDMAKSNLMEHRLFTAGMRSLHIAVGRASDSWMGRNVNDMQKRFTVRFTVPYSANYDVSFLGCKWYAGCFADIFVDDTYLGDYNFSDGDESFTSTRAYGENKQLNSVYLSAGAHEVSFRTRGGGVYSYPYLLLCEMTFTPSEESLALDHIQAKIPQKLLMGEEILVPFVALRRCGTKYHAGVTNTGTFDTENSFFCESSDESVLKPEGLINGALGDSGNASVRLIPQAAGTATVTLRATEGGDSKSISFPVEVTNEKLAAAGAHPARERIGIGDRVQMLPMHILDSGRTTDTPSIHTTYESLTPDIACIEGDQLIGINEGTARIQVTASFGGVTVDSVVEVKILNFYMAGIAISAGGSDYVKINGEKVPALVRILDNTGHEMDASGARITWQAQTPDILSIDADGYLTAHAEGEARLAATVTLGNHTMTNEAVIRTVYGKDQPTLVTVEERQNAIHNSTLFSWARAEIDTYIQAAEAYLNKEDELWSMVVSEGIPRSMTVGIEADPKLYYCRYCGVDLLAKYGSYAFLCDPLRNPWKVQCPDCRRLFPSNDFEGFYKLGLNEYGEFSLEQAKARNQELVNAGLDGHLKNILYPEAAEKFGDASWGVDDGFGYLPGGVIPNGKPERHTYIGYYLHWGVWRRNNKNGGVVYTALSNLANAYAYTGDVRYGRVGAIVLDRIADVYPGFDLMQYKDITWNSHGGTYRGKVLGNIWENGMAVRFAETYDLLYPAFDDPYVIRYLNDKSKRVKMRHSKENATQIRNNIEDGILRTIYEGVQDSSISGNFGYPQRTIATAAVVLDSLPETGEWLDWMMATGTRNDVPCTGGNVATQIVDIVDRDGQGNEASAYNIDWANSLILIADILSGYQKYPAADLYQNVKFRNMLESNTKMIASRYYTPQIGDSGSTASGGLWMSKQAARKGLEHYGDPVFAQYLYELNGQTTAGLRDEITAKNPEKIAADVQKIIDNNGRLDSTSSIMTGFGYAMIKDGTFYESTADLTSYNNQRNFWMYFGKNAGHGHRAYVEPGYGRIWAQYGAGFRISRNHRKPAKPFAMGEQYPVTQHSGSRLEATRDLWNRNRRRPAAL